VGLQRNSVSRTFREKEAKRTPLRFNEAGDINRQNGKSESRPSANIPLKKFLLFVSQ
jgi:hypothetical protein